MRAGAELWLAGVPIEWERRYHGERRRKRPLPTYPFARQRYWALEDPTPAPSQTAAAAAARAAGSVGSAGGQPVAPVEANYLMETVSWKRVQYSADGDVNRTKQDWLVFVSPETLDRSFANALSELGRKVTIVEKGNEFKELGELHFALSVNHEDDLDRLCAQAVKGIEAEERLQVVYFCDPSHPRAAEAVASEYRREVDDKLNAPITLVRSLMRHADAKNVSLTIVTRDGHSIAGTEATDPMMALPIGPCLAGMHEYPNLRCRIVDVGSAAPDAKKLARQLVADIPEPAPNVITAYRGGVRWARTIEPVPPFLTKDPRPPLRDQGRLPDHGGLGDLGLAISEHLATQIPCCISF